MLQYPVPLPPLDISKNPSVSVIRPNDPTSPRIPLSNKRMHNPRSAFPSPKQLSISTNFTPQQLHPSSSSSPSSTSFTLPPRNPYISSSKQPSASSPVSFPSSSKPPDSVDFPSPRPSFDSSLPIADVLAPGDIVAEGGSLQGDTIRLVSRSLDTPGEEDPATEFEVVRRLGTGSYAVVYLVREVLYRPPPSEDGHMSVMGSMELDDKLTLRPPTEYGREYAIKCLSKANLDEEALAAQMSEVTIHQSLRSHPNIVTLHRTLETCSFLLLLLEFVPGEDLFYFLEQARDHYELDSPACTEPPSSSSRTPPTPSLLSNLHPTQLLSRTRLRLIASMFSQMCEALAACHAQQVFHRDIKPENFIVTDGWATLADGRRERKVVVKLTDFGLSTTDLQSSDMDCGSAPYMSYECRNNVAPTYRPRGADVWSLGIVLINMLYHYNPWTDTTTNADWSPCLSFDFFRQQPVNFFMQRFAGMTHPVADLLANRVFCILEDQTDDSQRITASEFGAWAKDLPALLGDQSPSGHKRPPSASPTTTGHPLSSSLLQSHRPSSRQASGTPALRTPALASRSLSGASPLGPAYELEISELSTVYDQELEEQYEQDGEVDGEVEVGSMTSRTPSINKRRKRGARKGKGTPASTKDETLETLAVASQSLAREISKASRSSTKTSGSRSSRRNQPFEPVSVFPLPVYLISSAVPSPKPPAHTSSAPVVTKKPSKWKLSFGKSSGGGRVSPVEETSQSTETGAVPMTATVSNVSSLIMGLDAPPSHPGGLPKSGDSNWSRGRRLKQPQNRPSADSRSVGGRTDTSCSPQTSLERAMNDDRRAVSPASTRSGRPLASSGSSTASGNWRSSMSSAATSTSAFTRYSNSSMRSVSTTATSVSASSWRTSPVMKPASPPVPALPKNVKYMTGVPWELDQLPRGFHTNVSSDIPVRKHRVRKPKDLPLGTISERPGNAASKSPMPRRDASTSTTDLPGVVRDNGGVEDADSPKKVQRGQINALAKMLSALRR